MKRVLAVMAGLIVTSAASGHFVFIVPDGPGSGAGKVIFSDALKPDERVNIEKLAGTKLFVLVPGGPDTELKWTLNKDGACYKVEVPGTGPRVVGATTDYGVLQRGDSKPFRLYYYAKAVFGDLPSPEKATFGKRMPLELVPLAEAGKLRFQVLAQGQPLAKADVSVISPGSEKAESVTTDEKGITPPFEKTGRYGAHVQQTEGKTGEDRGKKYEEVRHYATAVLYFEKSGK